VYRLDYRVYSFMEWEDRLLIFWSLLSGIIADSGGDGGTRASCLFFADAPHGKSGFVAWLRKQLVKKMLFVQGGFVHAEEIKGIFPVLDGCIVGADVRKSLKPDEPRAVDLPGHPDRDRVRSQDV
jgi:hypothetical protein